MDNYDAKLNELEEKIATLEAEIQGLPDVIMGQITGVFNLAIEMQRSYDTPQEH